MQAQLDVVYGLSHDTCTNEWPQVTLKVTLLLKHNYFL